jgi:hypothetical protein
MDIGVVMLACAVVAAVAPRTVVVGKEMVLQKQIALYKQCLQSRHFQVKEWDSSDFTV